MDNVCRNYLTNNDEKDFMNEEFIRNRKKFFDEFIDDENQHVKYVLSGIGDQIILNLEQLKNLIHNSQVRFEIITSDCAIGILNNIPIIIEYL